MSASSGIDRAAAVRQALLELVADRGLHGAAMGEVARRAGVAAGTIYVHYADKESLILTVYAEVKRDLGLAAAAGWDSGVPPEKRFLGAWHRVHAHLVERPERARFLLQLEASPYGKAVHQFEGEVAGLWSAMIAELGHILVDLPPDVLYDLALGPAVTLAASAGGSATDDSTLDTVARGCWRAITR
ncbi:MAG: TetR/AcrR family transcriptional regulator [Geodermatophilaceae bacterium]|nr:TetR/AcrR family transcriptional regulator [Geodermatophilaceae bacterium]